MARTARDLTPQEWQAYQPVTNRARPRRYESRRRKARMVARQAADLLRHDFGASRVLVFGSVARGEWFTPWSDIDLAAWGIAADRYYSAVAAVTGLSAEFNIDLVDPETCRPAMREAIEREGIEP